MPIAGTLDVTPLLDDAPRMQSLDAQPWEIARVETLQLMFEIDDRDMASLLPKALHPTIPPVVMVSVARYPDSPAGAFVLAQVRVGCRAGVRPRGFLLQAYCDSASACKELASEWGYRCAPADIRLQRYHDRIEASVALEGTHVLRAALIDPEPVSGGDIQYVANVNLARLSSEGDKPLLVQVDPEFRFHRAERGRPDLGVLDRNAWHATGVDPVYPVHATFTTCDTGFPTIRYVMDPDVPAIAGTRAVGTAD